jgi:hypothetical protein
LEDGVSLPQIELTVQVTWCSNPMRTSPAEKKAEPVAAQLCCARDDGRPGASNREGHCLMPVLVPP